jgi:hypothetical protein
MFKYEYLFNKYLKCSVWRLAVWQRVNAVVAMCTTSLNKTSLCILAQNGYLLGEVNEKQKKNALIIQCIDNQCSPLLHISAL